MVGDLLLFFCDTIMLEDSTFCCFFAISMRTVTKACKLQISNNLFMVTVLLCSLKITNRNYSEQVIELNSAYELNQVLKHWQREQYKMAP